MSTSPPLDTGDHEVTNADRAERLHQTLKSYNDAQDFRANLIDILTDARHWCDGHELSFAELDRMAYQHYLMERDALRKRP